MSVNMHDSFMPTLAIILKVIVLNILLNTAGLTRTSSFFWMRCWTTIIIIIIAPLGILSEDEWGDLECLYKACQADITDGGLFTDTGVNERGENERQSENDSEMKTVS